MTGQEVHEILVARGVMQFHHANSVKTSLSQLRLGGLASRRRVEQENLPQTNQYTDNLDRRFDIWGDVFADTVDIHARASDRNKYGPVLFVLSIEILKALPAGSRVLVTRLNPSKWNDTQTDSQRYFMNAAELTEGLSVGNFDQMLVIRTTDGIVPFGHHLQSIILDEPRLTEGVGLEFCEATQEIANAASAIAPLVEIIRRSCNPRCRCLTSYMQHDRLIPQFFGIL